MYKTPFMKASITWLQQKIFVFRQTPQPLALFFFFFFKCCYKKNTVVTDLLCVSCNWVRWQGEAVQAWFAVCYYGSSQSAGTPIHFKDLKLTQFIYKEVIEVFTYYRLGCALLCTSELQTELQMFPRLIIPRKSSLGYMCPFQCQLGGAVWAVLQSRRCPTDKV